MQEPGQKGNYACVKEYRGAKKPACLMNKISTNTSSAATTMDMFTLRFTPFSWVMRIELFNFYSPLLSDSPFIEMQSIDNKRQTGI